MRVVLDATPMLGRRTGIGAYTAELLRGLAARPERERGELSLRATTFSARRRRVDDLPDGVRRVGIPLPARGLRAAWQSWRFPPIEALVGAVDVFHGTNFVSPPTLRAAEVVTIHDLTYELLPETVTPDVLAYRRLVTRALTRGAHVVTPTEVVAHQVRDFYDVPAGRVHATPLGVDPAWRTTAPLDDASRSRLGLPSHYLLFVGSLDPRKNLGTLVAAHAAARELDPELPPLVLAGPAGRAEGTSSPAVIRTGWLEDSDLRAVVAASDGVVLPSLDEGFGLPVLEALACGRPVLASDLPVLHEVGGTLTEFAPPTRDGLVDGLGRLAAAPDDISARLARQSWAARFDWRTTTSLTLAAYRAAAA